MDIPKKFYIMIKKIKKKLKNCILCAGNIATGIMPQGFWLIAGIDIVKVGIGPGSICTTRLGCGYWSSSIKR